MFRSFQTKAFFKNLVPLKAPIIPGFIEIDYKPAILGVARKCKILGVHAILGIGTMLFCKYDRPVITLTVLNEAAI